MLVVHIMIFYTPWKRLEGTASLAQTKIKQACCKQRMLLFYKARASFRNAALSRKKRATTIAPPSLGPFIYLGLAQCRDPTASTLAACRRAHAVRCQQAMRN